MFGLCNLSHFIKSYHYMEGTQFRSQHSCSSSHLVRTSVPRDLTPFSDLLGQHTHAGHKHIIKINKIKRSLSAIKQNYHYKYP